MLPSDHDHEKDTDSSLHNIHESINRLFTKLSEQGLDVTFSADMPLADNLNSLGESVINEINNRKEIERTLKKSGAILRSFYDGAPFMMGIVELCDDDIIHISDNAVSMQFFGRPISGRLASEIGASGKIIDLWLKHYHKSAKESRPVTFTYCHEWPNDARWLSATVAPISRVDDCHQQFYYLVEDITERKKIDDALRESNEHFRLFVESVKDYAIFMLDASGCVMSWNAGAERINGYSSDEIIGKYISIFYTQDSIGKGEPEYEISEARTAGRCQSEGLRIRKDGTQYWANDVTVALRNEYDQLYGFAKIICDITMQREAEEERNRMMSEIKYQAAKLHMVIENTDAQLALLDRNFTFTMVNTAYAENSGYTKEELLGKNHFSIFPSPENSAIFRKVRGTGRPYIAVERPFEHAGQPWRDVTYQNWSLIPIADQTNDVDEMLYTLTDVTSQVNSRKQLESLMTEAQYRSAELDATFASMIDGVIIYDLYGNIVRLNYAAKKILAFSEDDLRQPETEQIASLCLCDMDGKPVSLEDTPIMRALDGETLHGVTMLMHKENDTVWVSMSAAPIRSANGDMAGAVVSITDITQQIQMETALANEVNRNASIAEFAQKLLICEDIDSVDNLALSYMKQLTDSQNGLLVIINPETSEVVSAFTSNTKLCSHEIDETFNMFKNIHHWQKAVKTHRSIIVNSVGDFSKMMNLPEGHPLFNRFILAPAAIDGQLIGMIVLANAPREYTDYHLKIIESLVTLYSIVRQHAMVEAALHDALQRGQEQRSTLDAVFAVAPIGLLLLSPDRYITRVNDIAQQMIFKNNENIIGRCFGEVFACPNSIGSDCGQAIECSLCPIKNAINHAFIDNEPTQFMEISLPLDNSGVAADTWMLVGVVPTQKDNQRYVLVTLLDITVRKQTELDLLQARELADSANKAKSEFLSRMSHELRTPLNAILGFAQLMELDAETNDQRENTGQILKGGRHLLSLINDILDISRIETGNLHLSLESINIQNFLTDMSAMIKPLVANQSIEFRIEISENVTHFITGDLQRLKQVFLNLISNAIKYNKENGYIIISCDHINNDYVKVAIEDSGIGIASEHMDKLFQPFERLGADQTGIEGTGLGLALSRYLIEAMGGHIGVESIPGEGSTFWIELPITDVVENIDIPRQLPEIDVAPSIYPHTVLYIEDNLANIHLVERIISRLPGCELISAMQGSIGLELANKYSPDVILLDLHLPDIPGISVLHALYGNPQTSGIPVVVISADATPGQIERILEAGAYKYLTKPFEVQQVIDVLATLFNEMDSIHD